MKLGQILNVLYGGLVVRNKHGVDIFDGRIADVPFDLVDKDVIYMMPVGDTLVVDIEL